MSTGIVILAAGESTRMGQPKQLLAYRGSTLLQHTIDIAHTLPDAPVVVVLGANAEEIREQVSSPGVIIVDNASWRDGMGGSLRVGLRALLADCPKLSTATFLLCDQPLFSSEMLHELIATHERTCCEIVASEYNGTLGAPALFDCSLFPDLLALDSDIGARQIIAKHRAKAIGVRFPDGAIDIDTPADYLSLSELTLPV